MQFVLTHFTLLVSFYTPWKCQKTYGFMTLQRLQKETSGIKWVDEILGFVLRLFAIKVKGGISKRVLQEIKVSGELEVN